MRTAIVLVIGVCFVLCVGSVRAEQPTQVKAAIKAAEAWLAQVDAGKYGKSWDAAAPFFKQAVKRDQWIVSLQKVRKPLGKQLSRKLLGAKAMRDLPNAPKGEYVVMQFKADFAGKSGAVETITPMKTKAGKWRVSGYFIK
jgi:hypothetical protein